jgi:hypothetical protein
LNGRILLIIQASLELACFGILVGFVETRVKHGSTSVTNSDNETVK